MIYQFFITLKVLVNHYSSFEALKDFGRNVSRSANRWSVAEDFSRFFDRSNHFSFSFGGWLSGFGAISSRAQAQIKVPAQVRKSLEVKRSPITSRMYSLTL